MNAALCFPVLRMNGHIYIDHTPSALTQLNKKRGSPEAMATFPSTKFW